VELGAAVLVVGCLCVAPVMDWHLVALVEERVPVNREAVPGRRCMAKQAIVQVLALALRTRPAGLQALAQAIAQVMFEVSPVYPGAGIIEGIRIGQLLGPIRRPARAAGDFGEVCKA